MKAEDLGGFAAELLLGAIAQLNEIRVSLTQRALEATEFRIDFVLFDDAMRHMRFRFTEHKHATDHDSW